MLNCVPTSRQFPAQLQLTRVAGKVMYEDAQFPAWPAFCRRYDCICSNPIDYPVVRDLLTL